MKDSMLKISSCLLGLILLVAGCESRTSTSPSSLPAPPAGPFTVSGTVFEVIPGGRAPAANIPLLADVVTFSSCAAPCTSMRGFTRESTTSGPDGRYAFSQLPSGSVIVFENSATHLQVCVAFAVLDRPTQLDVEITSKTNPQPSPTQPPLKVTGLIYETTPIGRVGLDNARIYMEWFGNDLPFHEVSTDRDGRYGICGMPANVPISFEASKTGYMGAFERHQFRADTAIDIELKRQ